MPKFPELSNFGPQRNVKIPVEQAHRKLKKGSFSKVKEIALDGSMVVQEFMYCREFFQVKSQGIRRMLFCVPSGRAYAVAAFMKILESKLNLERKSTFGPTQRSMIMWIKVSPWWTQSSMKRSLFTALLRCGINYKPLKNNFEAALYSTVYTKKTRYAVARFLRGYTRYTGRQSGWYKQFYWGGGSFWKPQHPTNEEIDKLLIKPE